MKNYFLLGLIFISIFGYSQQNNIITKPLQLNSVQLSSGTSNTEKILVRDSDKVIKEISKDNLVKLTPGNNITITGKGTTVLPYVISSTSGNLDISSKVDKVSGKSLISDSEILRLSQITSPQPELTAGLNVEINKTNPLVPIINIKTPNIELPIFTQYSTSSKNAKHILFDADDNLYSINSEINTVSKTDKNGIETLFAITGTQPNYAIFDSYKNLYVTNTVSNNVTKITPSGVTSIYGQTDNGPTGLIFDEYNNLYVTNFFAQTITKITQDGTKSLVANLNHKPFRIIIDKFGFLYTSSWDSNKIYKIDPSDGIVTEFATINSGCISFIKDKDGNFYTSNQSTKDINKITPNGVVTTIATGILMINSLTFDKNENLFASNSSGKIYLIPKDGDKVLLCNTTSGLVTLTADSKGNLYTTSIFKGFVYKINRTKQNTLKLNENGDFILGDSVTENDLLFKQDKLNVGNNINIIDNTISANFNKLLNLYPGLTNGATTPVPVTGEGTLSFEAGHFFGWNGTMWKQLDN